MATLMLVDDESSILEVYRSILEMRDHRVVAEASDGDEALLLYSELNPKPDVIIMDHRMPKSNGITTMKSIHRVNPFQCIIFVTADFEAAKCAMDQGAHSFILKPFRMDLLFNSIEVALADFAKQRNQITESFLTLVTMFDTDNVRNVQDVSDRLEHDIIDTFIPSGSADRLPIETMANWLCKLLNTMGHDFIYRIENNVVLLNNKRCQWMNSTGPNPIFCFAHKCIIARLARKTNIPFTLDHHKSIMNGDKECLFEITFELDHNDI